MSTALDYPHLQTVGAEIRIGQSRYTVLHLAAEHYHYGWTAEELLRQHPDLRPEQVYAALTYFYDHREELVAQLAAQAEAAKARHSQAVTRSELLRRRAEGV